MASAQRMAALKEIALGPLELGTEALLQERILSFQGDDAVEGVGAVEGRGRPDHQIHAVHVEFRGPQKVTEGKVEAGRLVIHPVDDLQRAHRVGTVEAPGIYDLKAETGRSKVHVLEAAQAVVKVGGGRFLDRNRVEGFHGERRLLLLFTDPASPHLYHVGGDRIIAEADGQVLVGSW